MTMIFTRINPRREEVVECGRVETNLLCLQGGGQTIPSPEFAQTKGNFKEAEHENNLQV